MTDSTLDGTLAFIYVQCLLDALTPKLFERVINEANYPLETVLSVTAPGQYALPLNTQIALHQAINRLCGEPTLRLLNHNIGLKVNHIVETQQHPATLSLQGRYAALRPPEQIGRTLTDFCEAMTQMGLPLVSTPISDTTWDVTYMGCVTCAGVRVSAPICGAIAVVIRTRMQYFCGLPLTVQETQCRGIGDSECCYHVALVR